MPSSARVTASPSTRCASTAAVAEASSVLHTDGGVYDPAIFVDYTMRIIEGMGGAGPGVRAAALDLYDAWAACHHFTLYRGSARSAAASCTPTATRIGLISNTQRSLATFERHFRARRLFAGRHLLVRHGFMKPHPSIFEEGLRQAGVAAPRAVMVGDSVPHDIAGALRLGMRGVLVARSGLSRGAPPTSRSFNRCASSKRTCDHPRSDDHRRLPAGGGPREGRVGLHRRRGRGAAAGADRLGEARRDPDRRVRRPRRHEGLRLLDPGDQGRPPDPVVAHARRHARRRDAGPRA
jgi:HAD superfamily hydrolase (TIGR01509 family)